MWKGEVQMEVEVEVEVEVEECARVSWRDLKQGAISESLCGY